MKVKLDFGVEAQQNDGVYLEIPGLEAIGDGRFLLHGVKPRGLIDWDMMATATDGPLTDYHRHLIGKALDQADILTTLENRINKGR